MSLVLLSVVCRQALGYTRRGSGQKYLVKTGNKSPAKHLLVELEDSDYDPGEYDSVEGKIYCSFKDFYYIYCFLKNHMKEIQRWNVGMTMLIMTHRMYSAVSFWVCLCSKMKLWVFSLKTFQRVSLVEKG